MSQTEDKIKEISTFLEATKRRIEVLSNKVPKTRAEVFELEACLFDVRRANKAIRTLMDYKRVGVNHGKREKDG